MSVSPLDNVTSFVLDSVEVDYERGTQLEDRFGLNIVDFESSRLLSLLSKQRLRVEFVNEEALLIIQ